MMEGHNLMTSRPLPTTERNAEQIQIRESPSVIPDHQSALLRTPVGSPTASSIQEQPPRTSPSSAAVAATLAAFSASEVSSPPGREDPLDADTADLLAAFSDLGSPQRLKSPPPRSVLSDVAGEISSLDELQGDEDDEMDEDDDEDEDEYNDRGDDRSPYRSPSQQRRGRQRRRANSPSPSPSRKRGRKRARSPSIKPFSPSKSRRTSSVSSPVPKRKDREREREKEKERLQLKSSPLLPKKDSSLRIPHLKGNPVVDMKPCNCRNSQCLKLYCECFRARVFCNGCNCIGCSNTPTDEDKVSASVEYALVRNPHAFSPKIEKKKSRHIRGCKCSKSSCLKNYCECFQAGVPCSEACRCVDCKNTGDLGHLHPSIKRIKEKEKIEPRKSRVERELSKQRNMLYAQHGLPIQGRVRSASILTLPQISADPRELEEFKSKEEVYRLRVVQRELSRASVREVALDLLSVGSNGDAAQDDRGLPVTWSDKESAYADVYSKITAVFESLTKKTEAVIARSDSSIKLKGQT